MRPHWRQVVICSCFSALYRVVAVSASPPPPTPTPVALNLFPAVYVADLAITKIEPSSALLEHQPIRISFSLTVTKWGYGDPKPRGASVCAADGKGTCYRIPTLELRTYRGSIDAFAPAAAQTASLGIELVAALEPGHEFGEEKWAWASQTVAVAARYEVAITSFTTHHTRARGNDTVKISLQGMVEGQPSGSAGACEIVGPPRYCLTLVPYGDANDGVHPVTNVRVGSYTLVPETDNNLGVAFALVNQGTPFAQEVAQKVFNGISDITATALKVVYSGASSGWDGANSITHGINDAIYGGCDGPMASEVVILLNRTLEGQSASTLEARTRSTGQYSQTDGKNSGTTGQFEIDSQAGCGESGNYDVTWTVFRTSWQP